MKNISLGTLVLLILLAFPSFGQTLDVPLIEKEEIHPIVNRNESYALVCAPVSVPQLVACYAPEEPLELKQSDWTFNRALVYPNAYNSVEAHYLWKSRIADLGFTGSEYRYYDYPQIRN